MTSFAIIDPTAASWIPSADWANYKTLFLSANFTCADDGFSEVCFNDGMSCDGLYSGLPTFKYVLNATAVTMPPEAYTVSFPNYIYPTATNSCSIEMFPTGSPDTMTLGQIFAQQYALKFDYG